MTVFSGKYQSVMMETTKSANLFGQLDLSSEYVSGEFQNLEVVPDSQIIETEQMIAVNVTASEIKLLELALSKVTLVDLQGFGITRVGHKLLNARIEMEVTKAKG